MINGTFRGRGDRLEVGALPVLQAIAEKLDGDREQYFRVAISSTKRSTNAHVDPVRNNSGGTLCLVE